MKKYFFHVATLAIALILQSCEAKKSGESAEEMVKAANELDQKFAEAFSKGDVATIMDTYWNSPELVSYGPESKTPTNYEQTKAEMTKSFDMMKGAKLDLTNITNKAEGDVVLGHGSWTITLPDSAGTKITGRYTDVKAKKDGKWVYIMDHASVPLAPPAQ